MTKLLALFMACFIAPFMKEDECPDCGAMKDEDGKFLCEGE